MEGRIIKAIAGFYYVHNGEDVYECRARGVFRNKGIKPLVGDIAEVEILDGENKKGNLTEIKERNSFLIRPAVANPNQALIIFAGAKPEPNLNLLDKFFLEGVSRISLRNIIAREMISNTLMHREFTSSYIAKFVIEENRMYVENASRAVKNGFITPDNMEPNPKNPIIASFFRNICIPLNSFFAVSTNLSRFSIISKVMPKISRVNVIEIIVAIDVFLFLKTLLNVSFI